MVNNIKVSIVCTAFNHEQFIAQAIDSFLEQQCNFAYEIIIHEDCSTDGTKAIIEAYEKKHPDIIKPIYQPVNIYSKGEKPWVYCFKKAQGDYIALCDGDDYWTDPLKLQKQVDFLEENIDCTICFHRSYLLKANKLTLHSIPNDFNSNPFYYKELLRHYNFIATASVVLRKPKNFKVPKWFESLPFGDLGLYKIVSLDKTIVCLDEVMSVYRIHEGGLYSSVDELKALENYLSFYRCVNPVLTKEERQIVNEKKKGIVNTISKLKFPNSTLFKKLYYIYIRLKY